MAQSLAVRPTKDSVTLARVREIVEQFSERDRLGEIITAVHHIPAREAKFAPMPEWVREDLALRMREKASSSCTATRPWPPRRSGMGATSSWLRQRPREKRFATTCRF